MNPTPVKTQPVVGGKSFVEVVMNKGKDIEPVRTVEEKGSPAKPNITFCACVLLILCRGFFVYLLCTRIASICAFSIMLTLIIKKKIH